MISILKVAENGQVVNEGCRKHESSAATYYKWKAKYGGLDASESVSIEALKNTKLSTFELSA